MPSDEGSTASAIELSRTTSSAPSYLKAVIFLENEFSQLLTSIGTVFRGGHPGKALERTREVRLVGVPRRQCHLRERRVAPGYLATGKFNPEPPLVFSNAASVVPSESARKIDGVHTNRKRDLRQRQGLQKTLLEHFFSPFEKPRGFRFRDSRAAATRFCN